MLHSGPLSPSNSPPFSEQLKYDGEEEQEKAFKIWIVETKGQDWGGRCFRYLCYLNLELCFVDTRSHHNQNRCSVPHSNQLLVASIGTVPLLTDIVMFHGACYLGIFTLPSTFTSGQGW